MYVIQTFTATIV